VFLGEIHGHFNTSGFFMVNICRKSIIDPSPIPTPTLPLKGRESFGRGEEG
jgi:hypothetical protein